LLKEKIISDMKEALRKAGQDQSEKVKLATLRLLLSEIKNEEIKQQKELAEEEIYTIIQRQIKKREEAIEQYTKGNRSDLATKEEREALILKQYLPEQLSDEEIKEKAKAVIDQVGAHSMKDIGKVMGILMPQIKGRADGRRVSKIVGELLKA
jgi:hypothetical protein